MVLEADAFVTYSSYFKLQGRWRHSLSPVTYFSKLLGICSHAAFLSLELFRVNQNSPNCPVISVAKSSSRKGKIPSATGWSWRVR